MDGLPLRTMSLTARDFSASPERGLVPALSDLALTILAAADESFTNNLMMVAALAYIQQMRDAIAPNREDLLRSAFSCSLAPAWRLSPQLLCSGKARLLIVSGLSIRLRTTSSRLWAVLL